MGKYKAHKLTLYHLPYKAFESFVADLISASKNKKELIGGRRMVGYLLYSAVIVCTATNTTPQWTSLSPPSPHSQTGSSWNPLVKVAVLNTKNVVHDTSIVPNYKFPQHLICCTVGML